jgi:hypothetical protein
VRGNSRDTREIRGWLIHTRHVLNMNSAFPILYIFLERCLRWLFQCLPIGAIQSRLMLLVNNLIDDILYNFSDHVLPRSLHDQIINELFFLRSL